MRADARAMSLKARVRNRAAALGLALLPLAWRFLLTPADRADLSALLRSRLPRRR